MYFILNRRVPKYSCVMQPLFFQFKLKKIKWSDDKIEMKTITPML